MTTTTEPVQLPPVPTEVPLILRAPEDADRQVWDATKALLMRVGEIWDAMGRRDWERGAELLGTLGPLEYDIESKRQVVVNGDLNVDKLVLAVFADGDWHGTHDIDYKLGSLDRRLTAPTYHEPGRHYSTDLSPARAVFDRMRAEGKFKEHGGRWAFRLKKPGER